MKRYTVSISDESKAEHFLALMGDLPYLEISEHEEKPSGPTLAQLYAKQILKIIKDKKIPNIVLPADENGHACVDEELNPKLYDWVVNG